jgi:hypothetical protein
MSSVDTILRGSIEVLEWARFAVCCVALRLALEWAQQMVTAWLCTINVNELRWQLLYGFTQRDLNGLSWLSFLCSFA